MVQKTFVSYHEIAILCMIWGDFLIKFFLTTYFNKYVFYVLLVLMATTFLNPNSRNGTFIAFFLYLISYLVCMLPANSIGYTGKDEGVPGAVVPEFAYLLGLIPALGTAIAVYMGKYEVIEPTGPYGVGHSYKPISEDEHYMNCIVFYPVKKTEYDACKYHIRQNLKWYQPGAEGVQAMASVNKVNPYLAQEVLTYRISSVEDRTLQKDFYQKHKKLTPVVLSHGITHWCTTLSSLILELVSHGCIVFAVDHTDKSCVGYKNFLEEPAEYVPYCDHSEIKDKTQTEYHEGQLETRMKDIEYLLKFIKEEYSSDPWNVDINNLVALGHSFGATTAMEMCKRFPEFKLCCALDPYYMANYGKIISEKYYALEQPLLSLSSELFHSSGPGGFMANPWIVDKFDSIKANNQVFKDTEEKNKGGNYKIVIKGAAHNDMNDKCLYQKAIEERNGNSVDSSKYQVFINIVMAFLNEHNSLPVDFNKQVMEIASPHI